MKKFFIAIAIAFAAWTSQAVILNWYIDNDIGSPDYDYAQLVAVSANPELPTLYSYLIALDENGKVEDIDPVLGSWSKMNLDEYMTRYENGQTDPSVHYETEPPTDFNFSEYSFYFRMMKETGDPDPETGIVPVAAIEGADTIAQPLPDENGHYVNGQRTFAELKDYYFDAAGLYPTIWRVNINPVPEPATATLALLGAGLLFLKRRRG